MRKGLCTVFSVLLAVIVSLGGSAWTVEEETRISEHLPWGLPTVLELGVQTLSIRTAYIVSFNFELNCPDWAAYHVTKSYLIPLPRDDYRAWRDDVGVSSTGYKHSGYDQGHLAPFAIAGGIRQGLSVGACGDEWCDTVLRDMNLISNAVPQFPRFNQNGGLWYELETRVREYVATGRGDVWVVAGTVFWDGTVSTIGGSADIHVPHAFYKIIAWGAGPEAPQIAAFLFPHQESRVGEVSDFLVSIDLLEALTGLDFFSSMENVSEAELEAMNTASNWEIFLGQQSL